MKFTMFRKDKKNALHISTRTAEQVMNCMKGGRKAAVYEVCPNLGHQKILMPLITHRCH